MTVEQKFRVIVELLMTLNGRWSANKVIEIARLQGVEVRREDALRILGSIEIPKRELNYVPAGLRFDVLQRDNFTCRYCGASAPDVALHVDHVMPLSGGGQTVLENLVAACSRCNIGKGSRVLGTSREPVAGTTSEPLSEPGQEGSSPAPPSPRIALFTLPSEGTGANGATARKRKKIEDHSWFLPVEQSSGTILETTLAALTSEERFALSQFFAFKFGNCTVSESRNRCMAQKVACGFTDMACSARYGDMTVREFLAYAKKVHKRRAGKPWYNPWLIKGLVEFIA